MIFLWKQILSWFFWDKPKQLIKAWGNFLRFNFHFFSVGLLLKTLFSPWRKYEWHRTSRGFNLKAALEVHFSNLISRLLGAIVRLITILIALVVELLILFLGIIVITLWFFLPIILVITLIKGIKLLF